MNITEEEADLILEAFLYKATETTLYDSDEELLFRLLVGYPELQKRYATNWSEIIQRIRILENEHG